MTRINALRNIAETYSFITWGKNTGALVFAAVLLACSVTAGCSSDKPKSVSSNIQMPVPQAPSSTEPISTPAMQAATKPAPKKVVHKKPATVNYSDKTYGVTFEYPRRYAIETGEAATDLLTSSPLPMNFVQPGGVALAAVELPETSFVNTDFSSAFFDVSVHKNLTADQCSQFAVPQPKVVIPAATTESASAQAAPIQATKAEETTTAPTQTTPAAPAPAESAVITNAQSQSEPQGSKLMLGDLELRGTEAVAGEGTRQSDSKYFHVFQNGACYEFALNVTTVASEQGLTKHVDRDKVFGRLEQILSTVRINTVAAPEVAAQAPAPSTAGTPAQ
jgi:hypothetical protein